MTEPAAPTPQTEAEPSHTSAGTPRYDGDLREVPLGSLAYVGDAVYELKIRTHVLRGHRLHPGALHRRTIHYVRAAGQAEIYDVLLALATEEEATWLRRGRNADPGTMAKHQTPAAYRLATGVETLFGYLYLSGRDDRIETLMAAVIEAMDPENTAC